EIEPRRFLAISDESFFSETTAATGDPPSTDFRNPSLTPSSTNWRFAMGPMRSGMSGVSFRMSIDRVQSLSQLDRHTPGVDHHGRGDAVHLWRLPVVPPCEHDALGFEFPAELLEVLHFEPDVIDDAAGRRFVSDRLIAFPAEEVEAVAD